MYMEGPSCAREASGVVLLSVARFLALSCFVRLYCMLLWCLVEKSVSHQRYGPKSSSSLEVVVRLYMLLFLVVAIF